MRTITSVMLGILAHVCATAQSALPDRGDSLVETTRVFAFYSDPVFNLHDFLVWSARHGELPEPAPGCLTNLPQQARAAFEQAREHYEVFATRGGNRLLLALRYRLAGFGDFGLVDADEVDAALAVLTPAARAYEECWWPAHNTRNREWIEALESLLTVHEVGVRDRLVDLYGQELAGLLPVDVVSYGSFTGADSVINPDHLLISSVEPSNAGLAALEIVFHEASHTAFGPGTGGLLWTEFEEIVSVENPPLPRDFWHAMLFYTTGAAVKAHLAGQGMDYEQYLYTEGLFDRSWPGFQAPLERLWQPYIDGHATMREALTEIIAAPKLAE